MIARTERRGPRWLQRGVAVLALAACGQADAATYRCDDAGKVTYTDLPCATGTQNALRDLPRGPSADDRVAAANRRRADESALLAFERERAQGRHGDERAASAARRNADHDKRAATCTKLALRAKHAGEDAETAGPREQPRKRTLARRADEAYVATCRKR